MTQAKNGIRLAHIGFIAGAAVCALLLGACSQTASTAATKTGVSAPAQKAGMDEVVITASRQPTPQG